MVTIERVNKKGQIHRHWISRHRTKTKNQNKIKLEQTKKVNKQKRKEKKNEKNAPIKKNCKDRQHEHYKNSVLQLKMQCLKCATSREVISSKKLYITRCKIIEIPFFTLHFEFSLRKINISQCKKSLKIPKGQSESVY